MDRSITRRRCDAYDMGGEREVKKLRIDWTALVESVAGSMLLVTVAAIPLLLGRPIAQWALAAAVGLVIGLVVYVRVELRRRSGKGPRDESDEEFE